MRDSRASGDTTATPEAAGSSPVAPVSRSGLLEPNPRPARAAEQAKAVPPAKRAGGRFGALAGHESNAAPGSSQAWSARRTRPNGPKTLVGPIRARWGVPPARLDALPARPGGSVPESGSVRERYGVSAALPRLVRSDSNWPGIAPKGEGRPAMASTPTEYEQRARSRSWPGGVSL
jgi:hypothetical protein